MLVCCSTSWSPISCNWPTPVWPLTISASYWWNSWWPVYTAKGWYSGKQTNKQCRCCNKNTLLLSGEQNFCCHVNRRYCCQVNNHFCCHVNKDFCCHAIKYIFGFTACSWFVISGTILSGTNCVSETIMERAKFLNELVTGVCNILENPQVWITCLSCVLMNLNFSILTSCRTS